MKKRPLAPSNSADSPMLTAKSGTDSTTSPVDIHPLVQPSPAISTTMSPKPSTIQRIQSFFRHTPRKSCSIYFSNFHLDLRSFFFSIQSYYQSTENNFSRYRMWSIVTLTRQPYNYSTKTVISYEKANSQKTLQTTKSCQFQSIIIDILNFENETKIFLF